MPRLTDQLPPLTVARPHILVSQCLQGDSVRYDGGHKHQPLLQKYLWPAAQPVSVCPEMAAGLGLPRPPIRRQQGAQGQYLALAESGVATAPALVPNCKAAASALAQAVLSGAVLKARSPSCGIGNSPLFDESGNRLALGDGVWVQALRAQLPALPMVHEDQLRNGTDCQHFLALAQLAKLLSEQSLPELWREYLACANALHQGPELGLAKVARHVGGETAALDYLLALPLRSRMR